VAVYLGPVTVIPILLFSGFFLSLNNIPVYMQWLSYVAYVRYGFEGTMMVAVAPFSLFLLHLCRHLLLLLLLLLPLFLQAIYGFDRPKLVCSQAYCHFKYPHKFLEELALQDAVRSNPK
jgi:hypothetical protein